MTFFQGIGRGGVINQAKVDSEGRIEIRSISQDDTGHAVDEGRAYQAYSGILNFGSATKQMAFYIKNNEESQILITSATVGTRVAAGASDNIMLLEQVGNVMPSDAIVSATDAIVVNRNAGNAGEFSGDVKVGPSVISGVEVAVNGTLGDFTASRTFDLTAEIPKGGSLGVAVTPPASNTDMDFTITVAFHIKEDL